MKHTTLRHLSKALLIGSFLAFASVSLQGCNDQAKEVKTDRALKSNCQMQKCKSGKCGTAKATKVSKCKTGKCGDAKKAPAMKCEPGKCATGKCGNAKKAAPAMKCEAGKCASGKCGQGK